MGRLGPQRSLVDAETLSYLTEVTGHFKVLTDDAERDILLDNVLSEIVGKELKICTDPVCSRHIESLWSQAHIKHVVNILKRLTDGDTFSHLCISPFGSHVADKLLASIDSQMAHLGEDETEEVAEVIEVVVSQVCEYLYDYVTDRFASHVVRRLLCVLAGHDVLPPTKSKGQTYGDEGTKEEEGPEPPGNDSGERSQGSSRQKGKSALAEKVSGGSGMLEGGTLVRFPSLLAKVVEAMKKPEFQGDSLAGLLGLAGSSAVLQSLLRAVRADRDLLRQLLPQLLGATAPAEATSSKLLAHVDEAHVQELMCQTSSSHLVECILQVAPPEVYQQFMNKFLAGSLYRLALHPSANFVVQAALGAAHEKRQVEAAFRELEPHLGDLLLRRRSGVVTTLVAACGRSKTCEGDLCRTLAASLSMLPGFHDMAGDGRLAGSLMTLDTPAQLCTGDVQEGPSSSNRADDNPDGAKGTARIKLSATGCAMLIRILSMSQGASREFTDSVAGLSPRDLVTVGTDPGGSRVLEAMLAGGAPSRVKSKVLEGLQGHYGEVGLSAPGSYLVEKCFLTGDIDVKEAIVRDLLTVEGPLGHKHWGPSLLRATSVESYKRSPSEWRQRIGSMARTVKQFVEIFGSGADRSLGGKEKKRKREQGPGEGASDQHGGTSQALDHQEPEQCGDKHHGKKLVEPPCVSRTLDADGVEVDPSATEKIKKKKKKKKDMSLGTAGAAARTEGDAGEQDLEEHGVVGQGHDDESEAHVLVDGGRVDGDDLINGKESKKKKKKKKKTKVTSEAVLQDHAQLASASEQQQYVNVNGAEKVRTKRKKKK